MTQRDYMRLLFKHQKGVEALIIKAYAMAEKRGIVVRKSNKFKISAETYARALFKDGSRKGWI